MEERADAPRCILDLQETPDGRLAAVITASRYHLQWHALPEDVLSTMVDLLASPTEEFREAKLGEAFGNADVVLVVHETVVRLKVLRRGPSDASFADLLEVTLSYEEARSLLHAVREAQDLWGPE